MVALVGLVLLAGGAGLTLTAVALVAAGAAAFVLGIVIETRRRGRLARLDRFARELLSADLITKPEVGPASTQWARSEFSSLRETLVELSERLQMELKEAAKRGRNLEALIDALDEPVLATDNDDNVLLCNRSAESLFDLAAGSMIGRPLRSIFTHSKLLDVHAEAKGGRVHKQRMQLTTTLGARTFQVSASPVPVAWGEGIFGAMLVLRDVTELDRAMEMKSDFVANASHELRTPISAIRGAAETLADLGDEDGAMSARLTSMILSHAERLEEMIRDLLDLSRLESPDLRVSEDTVDIEEMAGALRSMFEHACARRELTLEFELDPAAVRVTTDGRLLFVVLRNLIENATRFAFEGTSVLVLARLVDDGSVVVDGGARATMRVEVVDRGVGIPIAQQERVFERYYQVEAARTGTGSIGSGSAGGGGRGSGLGLSIVKHAVRALDGAVGVQSTLGEGSTFWVEVPVTLGGPGTEPDQPAGA